MRRRIESQADLGALPFAVAWPSAPSPSRRVEVRTAAEFTEAARQGDAQIVVAAPIRERVEVHGANLEITQTREGRMGRVFLGPGVSRLAFRGGRYERIQFQVQFSFYPEFEVRPDFRVTDVLIDGAEFESPAEAMLVRGQRIAIINCRARTQRYCVWAGDGVPEAPNEDIIVAGNDFFSTGEEATVRFVGSQRTVTVFNVFENERKHNYRVHGFARYNYANSNTLLRAGVMTGSEVGDDLDHQWFVGNVFHHTLPDLFNHNPRVTRNFVVRDNVVYTDVWDVFVTYGDVPSWTVENNELHPYRPPPPGVHEFEARTPAAPIEVPAAPEPVMVEEPTAVVEPPPEPSVEPEDGVMRTQVEPSPPARSGAGGRIIAVLAGGALGGAVGALFARGRR